MKTLVKKAWLLFTLGLMGLVATSCNNDDDDNSGITGHWLMTNKQYVTMDTTGHESVEDMRMMTEEIWEFNSDGTWNVINDGYISDEKYNYTINGLTITLSPADTTKDLETMTGPINLQNKTMTICINQDESGDEYYKYTFSKQQE